MISLLPEKEKREVRALYRGRRLVVWLVFGLAFLVLSTLMLLPSWVLLSQKRIAEQSALERAKNRPVSKEAQALSAEISDTNNELRPLLSSSTPMRTSRSIEEVLAAQGSGVTLSSVVVSEDNTLQVRGVAGTREDLLAFIAALQKSPHLSDVISPIANLIKNKDIQFDISMRVTL